MFKYPVIVDVMVVDFAVTVGDFQVFPVLGMIQISTGEVCQQHTKRDRQQQQGLKAASHSEIHEYE